MAQAVALGDLARRRTAPNPWVGCVIVRDGAIVADGATQPPGGRHAEAVALRHAGDRARGATVYTTLEPCSHHGRTPPCADALIDAGVDRVVVALVDPDPQVRGGGIVRLRAAGLTVDVGVGADAAAESLLAYLVHRRDGRAAVVVKVASSLDGRTAAADGSSQWITGSEARADVHDLRADSQAVVVGAGTALADRPRLTVREATTGHADPPLRVLLDARGRVPADGPLFDLDLAPTLVVTTAAAPDDVVGAWLAAGAKVQVVAPASPGVGVDLRSTFELLGGLGVLQALVEPGPTLAGALLDLGAGDAALVDRLVAYVAPTVLGVRGRPAFDLPGPDSIDDATRWRLRRVTQVGDDVRLDLEPASVAERRDASVAERGCG
jgi:diaminohydroxyphosphoribosylaminopyrimidine deaminase/5-amino-6-(5-phosphoribosylamino)uracil reductase